MTDQEKLAFLKELQDKAGVEFVVSGHPAGMCDLSPEELIELIKYDDGNEYWAKQEGVTVEQFKEFYSIAHGGGYQCAGKTKSGQQCRNIVHDVQYLDIHTYIKHKQNLRCKLHRDPAEFTELYR